MTLKNDESNDVRGDGFQPRAAVVEEDDDEGEEAYVTRGFVPGDLGSFAVVTWTR